MCLWVCTNRVSCECSSPPLLGAAATSKTHPAVHSLSLLGRFSSARIIDILADRASRIAFSPCIWRVESVVAVTALELVVLLGAPVSLVPSVHILPWALMDTTTWPCLVHGSCLGFSSTTKNRGQVQEKFTNLRGPAGVTSRFFRRQR